MILLVRFIGNVAAIWVASELLDGVTYGDEWQNLLLAALVLTIANWLVKPFLTLLTLPVIVLTLGIALFNWGQPSGGRVTMGAGEASPELRATAAAALDV